MFNDEKLFFLRTEIRVDREFFKSLKQKDRVFFYISRTLNSLVQHATVRIRRNFKY